MNKNKRDGILAILVFVLILASIVGAVVLSINNNKKNEATSNEVLGLITENIIDFKNHDFKSEEVKYKFKPTTHDNIILVHLCKDEWNAYNVMGLTLDQIKTKEDLEKVDVIAFAISEFYSSDYKYVNTNTKVKLSTEKVTIYLYNPKEKRVFIMNTLPAKELPKKTSSTVNYTHSLYEITTRIKKNFGVKTKSTGKVIAIILFALIGLFVIYRVFITIKNDKLKHNKNMNNS